MADKKEYQSPTGYWAIYLFTDDFLARVRKQAPGAPPIDARPVVTWTPGGEAAVFDDEGKLTPVSRLHLPTSAEYIVHTLHPDDWRVDA